MFLPDATLASQLEKVDVIIASDELPLLGLSVLDSES